MTVLGLDISKWNGNWNAAKARAAGVAFAFIKASQATFTDPKFIDNWKNAKDAGLMRGAYHYLDYTKPAGDQADYFANLLETDPGELPLVVDYEEKRTDNDCGLAKAYLREFLSQLQVRNIKPMIYLSRGFWTTYGDSTAYWMQFPLWLAHWMVTESPPLPAPWGKWTFWQFTADGPGETFGTESVRVDMNHFYGSLDELKKFSETYLPKITPEVPSASNEERINTLESILSTLEPVFTEAYSKLDERISALENGTISGGSDSSSPSYNQRIITVEQKISALSQQNTTMGNQIASFNQFMNTFNQKLASFSSLDMSLVTGLENRILEIEQKIVANQSGTQNTSPQPSSPATGQTYAVCTVRGLNVRSGPGLSYPVITGLTYGQKVKFLDRTNGWVQIQNPAGWCAEMYLSFQ